MKEKEYYKRKIIEMLEEIENMIDIRMIYGMTKAAFDDIKKGNAEE